MNRLAQESLIDESLIFFSIPIGMKTLLKTNLGSVLSVVDLYVQFLW